MSVNIPSSVENIEMGAFGSCSKLVYASVDAKNIGDAAFSFCLALNTLIIGDSTKSIGTWAFTPTAVNTVYYNASGLNTG